MTLTIITEHRCPVCGHTERGFYMAPYRVNKHSLRQIAPGIGAGPRLCGECGCRDVAAAHVLRLDRASAAAVRAARARKGWAA